MKITESFLKQNTCGALTAICLTSEQARILGLKYPLPYGWIYRVLDNHYTQDQIASFVDAKSIKKGK